MEKMCDDIKIEKEKYVTKLILDMGVPAHLKGYHYLRKAILMSEEDIKLQYITPAITARWDTAFITMEQIRNAIEVSWVRGNTKTIENLFGYSTDKGKGRPTNSEYIARVADKVHLDFKLEESA